MNQKVSKLINKIASLSGKNRKMLKKTWNKLPRDKRSILHLKEAVHFHMTGKK